MDDGRTAPSFKAEGRPGAPLGHPLLQRLELLCMELLQPLETVVALQLRIPHRILQSRTWRAVEYTKQGLEVKKAK